MSAAPILVWLENDLRLEDNPALYHAAETGSPALPVYILDDKTPGRWKMGGASRWWLHHSLEALSSSLHKHGVPLVLRRGEAHDILPILAVEMQAQAVFWNRRCEPASCQRDDRLTGLLQQQGLNVRQFSSALLFEPEHIRTQSGGVFKVFTPFWRACRQLPAPPPPLPVPALRAYNLDIASDDLTQWGLLPVKPDWAGGLRKHCKPGEKAALERWKDFLAHGLAQYAKDRDFPAKEGSSGLSPHIHFGEISVRRIWHDCQMRGDSAAADKFLSEIGWREFNHYLLAQFPPLPEEPFNPAFTEFPWQGSKQQMEAWQRGQTGYPIVDAGMRELWETGLMHNRVRMLTASFLTKHLLIPWQEGEAWFWDTLVDADLANNAGNWQWVAGCGADAAPYFRIFSPEAQGKRFDPEGEYVRRWVPELAKLPAAYIHAPWKAPADILARAGVKLGSTYPQPIVDHDKARMRALEAYRKLRAAA